MTASKSRLTHSTSNGNIKKQSELPNDFHMEWTDYNENGDIFMKNTTKTNYPMNKKYFIMIRELRKMN